MRLDTTERASSQLRSEKDDCRIAFFARLERSRHVGYQTAFNRSASLLNLPRLLLLYTSFSLGSASPLLHYYHHPLLSMACRKEPGLLPSSDYHHFGGPGKRKTLDLWTAAIPAMDGV